MVASLMSIETDVREEEEGGGTVRQQYSHNPPVLLRTLPTIDCKRCHKPVGWGTVGALLPGQLLVLQCLRRECGVWNTWRG